MLIRSIRLPLSRSSWLIELYIYDEMASEPLELMNSHTINNNTRNSIKIINIVYDFRWNMDKYNQYT